MQDQKIMQANYDTKAYINYFYKNRMEI